MQINLFNGPMHLKNNNYMLTFIEGLEWRIHSFSVPENFLLDSLNRSSRNVILLFSNKHLSNHQRVTKAKNSLWTFFYSQAIQQRLRWLQQLCLEFYFTTRCFSREYLFFDTHAAAGSGMCLEHFTKISLSSLASLTPLHSSPTLLMLSWP